MGLFKKKQKEGGRASDAQPFETADDLDTTINTNTNTNTNTDTNTNTNTDTNTDTKEELEEEKFEKEETSAANTSDVDVEKLKEEASTLREQLAVLQSSLEESKDLSDAILHEKQSLKEEYDEQLRLYRAEQEILAKEYQEKHDQRYEQLSLVNVELQATNEDLQLQVQTMQQRMEEEGSVKELPLFWFESVVFHSPLICE